MAIDMKPLTIDKRQRPKPGASKNMSRIAFGEAVVRDEQTPYPFGVGGSNSVGWINPGFDRDDRYDDFLEHQAMTRGVI